MFCCASMLLWAPTDSPQAPSCVYISGMSASQPARPAWIITAALSHRANMRSTACTATIHATSNRHHDVARPATIPPTVPPHHPHKYRRHSSLRWPSCSGSAAGISTRRNQHTPTSTEPPPSHRGLRCESCPEIDALSSVFVTRVLAAARTRRPRWRARPESRAVAARFAVALLLQRSPSLSCSVVYEDATLLDEGKVRYHRIPRAFHWPMNHWPVYCLK